MGTKYEGDVDDVTVQRDKETLELKGLVLGGAGTAVGRAFLGILPIRDDPTAGVEVRYVYPKSPAEAAGIKVGDRIQKIGRSLRPGQPPQMAPVANRDALLAIFDNAGANVEVKFEVKRKDGDKVETLSATLGTTPDGVPEKLPADATLKKAAGAKTEKVDVGLLRRQNAAGDRDYWVYIPENYDGNCSYAVVVWLHPPRKNKERDIDDFIFAWQGYCEDHRIILVGPSADNETGWTPGDSALVNEAVRFVADTYTVDRRRVVAHGMGQGGQFAYYLGFNSRATIRGVAVVGAALASNPKEPVNNQPLAFYLVAGGKDPLKDAIAESRTQLAEQKYPVGYREIPEMGHQYIDGGPGIAALDELVRWLDSLDRL
jgi:serine protease Do